MYDPNGDGGDYIPPQSGQTDGPQPPAPQQESHDPYGDYNGGSPPDAPLQAGYGWEWTGSRWVQVSGRGLGYQAAPKAASGNSGGGNNTTSQSSSVGGKISGVPSVYSGGQSPIGGSVPTLQDAITAGKSLPQLPAFSPYANFQAPQAVGVDQRNSILNAVLNKPQVLDQNTQDAMYEQQKEQQNALAQQFKQQAGQAGAGRGFSSTGGYQAAATNQANSELGRGLMAARRDISVQAAQLNRQSEIAAVQLQEALAQGDFERAAQAHQLQTQTQDLFNQLQIKAAEFDRANTALAAQTQMAGRQQQLGEQMSAFNQYMQQKQMDETIRQFNAQMGLDWSKFGWGQQFDTASLFPQG